MLLVVKSDEKQQRGSVSEQAQDGLKLSALIDPGRFTIVDVHLFRKGLLCASALNDGSSTGKGRDRSLRNV